MIIVESPKRSMDLFQDSDFLLQVFNDGLLLPVYPTGQAKKYEFHGIPSGTISPPARI
jgi:hypothetical protein